MAKHHLTGAQDTYYGEGFHAGLEGRNGRRGVEAALPSFVDLGTPAVADPNHIIDAATSTELPDTETVTYTTANDGVSPIDNGDTPAPADVDTEDGVVNVWTIDAPRNMEMLVTHGSSIVAMTATITGYDEFGEKVVEDLAVTATGTSKTAVGLKSFKHILSIAFTAAANAEANTANVGTGDRLGLPMALNDLSDLIAFTADGESEFKTVRVRFEVEATEYAAGTSVFVVAPVKGEVHKVATVVTTATTGEQTVTVELGGVAVAGLSVTIVTSSSVGDIDSDTGTAGDATAQVEKDGAIEIDVTATPTAGAIEGYVEIIPTGIVVADATTVTATTGDVRGTVEPTDKVLDGSIRYGVWYYAAAGTPNTRDDIAGVPQFKG